MSKATAEKKEEGVKVFLRIRPFSKKEIDASGGEIPSVVTMPTDPQKLHFLDPMSDWEVKEAMSFDEIFWSIPASQCPLDDDVPFATQDYVYAQTGKLCLDHAFEGYNSCMLAYGQTGSGKTHSMLGNPADEGIIPKLCKELFDTVERKRKEPRNDKVTYKIMVSFLEIYNEKVKDLLAVTDIGEEGFKALKIRNHPTRGPFVEGLLEEEVGDWETCNRKIEDGFAARTTKATAMNAVSSRSHAIFKIELTQSMKAAQRGKQVHTISSINLVDLAGSERASRTGAKGDTLTEGIAINQSLTVLRKVIEALMENGKALKESKQKGTPYRPQPPPYRESTLTWLLSESFGGNSKTMMIAAASPHESNAEETLQTLKYALKTKEIVNTVTRNEDKGMRLLREKNDEIEKLRQALQNAAMNPNPNSPENEERMKEIQDRLRQEEAAKTELMEEHEKLTAAMEAKEEEVRRAQMERETAAATAKKEAEERARTQRAADIMGKWTRGFAYSLDSAKTKKLKEKEAQLVQIEGELDQERQERQLVELENVKRMQENSLLSEQLDKERDTFKTTLANERQAMQQELRKTKERLQDEHDSVINAYKHGLHADNERLQRELAQTRDESGRTIQKLTDDNEDLRECLGRCKSDVAALRQTIDSNAAAMDGTRSENRIFRQEIWDLKEANARLREENSKLRLVQLQNEAQLAAGGGLKQPSVKEMRTLEAKINELLEDKAVRVKDVALLKADKKALQMENRELELSSDTAKKAEYVLQGKLLTLEAEHNRLKEQLQQEEIARADGVLSKKDELIMDLNAQLALMRGAKEKAEERVSECTVENEQLRIELATLQGSAMNATAVPTLPLSATPHNFVSPMSGGNRPALMNVPTSVSPQRMIARGGSSTPSPTPAGTTVLGGMTIATGTAVVAEPPEGKVILNVVKEIDSKVTQCRKALLLLRMQGDEDEDGDVEEALAHIEHQQQQIGHLLADVSVATQDTYENVKGILAQVAALQQQQSAGKDGPQGSGALTSPVVGPTPPGFPGVSPQRHGSAWGGSYGPPDAGTHEGQPASAITSPSLRGFGMSASAATLPADSVNIVEKLKAEKQQLAAQLDELAEKVAELDTVNQQLRREAVAAAEGGVVAGVHERRSSGVTRSRSPSPVLAPAPTATAQMAAGVSTAEHEAVLEKLAAVEEELASANARPPQIVEKVVEIEKEVERIVEVPINAVPPDVSALQEELEEAQGDVEFFETMKDELEKQLDDFKDFQARYFKIIDVLTAIGLEGDGSVEGYVECLKDMKAAHVKLTVAAEELAEAKKVGIGASAEEYEFYVAKARILEETVTDESAARAAMEKDLLQARYDLQREREEREVEARKYQRREEEIKSVFAAYEEEVRRGFGQCRDRHSAVWQELNVKKRELAELQARIVDAGTPPLPIAASTESADALDGVSTLLVGGGGGDARPSTADDSYHSHSFFNGTNRDRPSTPGTGVAAGAYATPTAQPASVASAADADVAAGHGSGVSDSGEAVRPPTPLAPRVLQGGAEGEDPAGGGGCDPAAAVAPEQLSPDLVVEETSSLLARHEQLSANRRKLEDSIKRYTASPRAAGGRGGGASLAQRPQRGARGVHPQPHGSGAVGDAAPRRAAHAGRQRRQ